MDYLSDVPHAYFMNSDNALTIQRMDPIRYPGVVGSHVHSGMDLRLSFRMRRVSEGACSVGREHF